VRMAVVDALEVVDVEHRHRQRAEIGDGAGQPVGQRDLERAPVRDAGQGVLQLPALEPPRGVHAPQAPAAVADAPPRGSSKHESPGSRAACPRRIVVPHNWSKRSDRHAALGVAAVSLTLKSTHVKPVTCSGCSIRSNVPLAWVPGDVHRLQHLSDDT
jgi:hypothetical protein